jgi:hypothetical protein
MAIEKTLIERLGTVALNRKLHMTLGAYVLIVFALGSFVLAQTSRTETMVEIKTVAQCRSYREAWATSVDYDTEHSSARLLYNRAEQLITCAKDIDKSPLEAGMTVDESMKAVIAHSSYAILAATYYQTAFQPCHLVLK